MPKDKPDNIIEPDYKQPLIPGTDLRSPIMEENKAVFKKRRKGSWLTKAFVSVALLAGLGGSAYWYAQQGEKAPSAPKSQEELLTQKNYHDNGASSLVDDGDFSADPYAQRNNGDVLVNGDDVSSVRSPLATIEQLSQRIKQAASQQSGRKVNPLAHTGAKDGELSKEEIEDLSSGIKTAAGDDVQDPVNSQAVVNDSSQGLESPTSEDDATNMGKDQKGRQNKPRITVLPRDGDFWSNTPYQIDPDVLDVQYEFEFAGVNYSCEKLGEPMLDGRRGICSDRALAQISQKCDISMDSFKQMSAPEIVTAIKGCNLVGELKAKQKLPPASEPAHKSLGEALDKKIIAQSKPPQMHQASLGQDLSAANNMMPSIGNAWGNAALLTGGDYGGVKRKLFFADQHDHPAFPKMWEHDTWSMHYDS